MWDGQPSPHVALIHDHQHIVLALVFDITLQMRLIAPKKVHMLHMLWFVACGRCNVMGTQWRHTLEASRSSCPSMLGLDAWISPDKDIHFLG